ncbi:MAG: hypothetical protein HUJ76_10695, partial [Parasporobacterium sp.]|nr:hypothetical protein [Parasporobacterium sp.]
MFEGFPEITKEIKEKIINSLKVSDIPNPDYFISLDNVLPTFGYNDELSFDVHYTVTRFFK